MGQGCRHWYGTFGIGMGLWDKCIGMGHLDKCIGMGKLTI